MPTRGEEFNLGSPAQLGQILYGRLGLSYGGPQEGQNGLLDGGGRAGKIAGRAPGGGAHYAVPGVGQADEHLCGGVAGAVASDGRVHTSFSQVIAQTGRLSSNNPNLQNIPVRTELGRENPPGVCGAGGPGAGERGLLADRAGAWRRR
jgi:DNA polymerase-1